MRWLSPPESVPEARASVEIFEPDVAQEAEPLVDLLEDALRDLAPLGVSSPGSAANQSTASAIDRFATSEMFLPRILTAKASGLSRAPQQTSHNVVVWKRARSSRTQALSVSFQRRSRLGITPSKGLVVW